MAAPGEKSGFGVAHDFRGVGRENGDFPILCETCLGDNPFVRLQRDSRGKECQICQKAYTGFRWKPGAKARYKVTIVCQMCARLKNVCQTCLFDLEYGLPVEVRDKYMESAKLALPEHPVNREYMTGRLCDSQLDEQLPYGKSEDVHMKLKMIARNTPYYKRNLPRVCTFWQRGECTRGDECPYLHEQMYSDPLLAAQNVKDRYVGVDDPVAQKIMRITVNRQVNACVTPPEDKKITTLFAGCISETVTDVDIRNAFVPFGEILSIKVFRPRRHAFICFANRDSCERAIASLGVCFSIKDSMVTLTWAKPKTKALPDSANALNMPQDTQQTPSGSSEQITPGFLPPPIPGLPPIVLPPHMQQYMYAQMQQHQQPHPPIYGTAGPSAVYSSMRPHEAELAKNM